MRFLTAVLAMRPGQWRLTGSSRMKKRPISPLVEALRQMGADIHYEEQQGFPPLRMEGKILHGGNITLTGDVSSQFVSALLLIAPLLSDSLTVELQGDIVSRPYIDLTLSLMNYFGAEAGWVSGYTMQVHPHPYQGRTLEVEGDWTAASYWYEMMALHPDAQVQLPNLSPDSMQGDRIVADWFRQLQSSHHVETDMAACPDLVPACAVACALKGIPFRFTGIGNLRWKETDRINALQTELRKWGFVLKDTQHTLYWDGERCMSSDEPIDTWNDHRIAMAFAVASAARGTVRLIHPEVVTKSYPSFWEDLRNVGFQVEE